MIGLVLLFGDDDAVTNTRMLRQDSFNFLKLNAKPANFHLPVDSTDEFDIAVR